MNFAPMAKRNEREFDPADVEDVDDAVITHAQSEFRAPLQARVRKIIQAPAQFA